MADHTLSKAAQDVLAERLRQVTDEGCTPEHDDTHDQGEMLHAAISYAQNIADHRSSERPPARWPWAIHWWKPKDQRRDLVRAAALIIAEIERLDRLGDGT